MPAYPFDEASAALAEAIGEPARARMLYLLVDGRARTSTELAVAADVGASTASVHLKRLEEIGLVAVQPQGRHRYYKLNGPEVARVLEALSVLAGAGKSRKTHDVAPPSPLRGARTCYDHIAGALGVALLDRLLDAGWLSLLAHNDGDAPAYRVTDSGARTLERAGVDVEEATRARRRFAYGCLDWTERRSHLGGALGAALLDAALRQRWVATVRDSRALRITAVGGREFSSRLGVRLSTITQ